MAEAGNTLLLWGDTQVGKTTLLATALYHDPRRLPQIDRARSAASIHACLWTEWQRLRTGRAVNATAVEHMNVELITVDDQPLVIRDIRGGLTRQVDRAEVVDKVRACGALLFVMEWASRTQQRQLDGIEGALDLVEGRPCGLAFTKCEFHFTEEDPAWQAAPDWWRHGEWSRSQARVLERLKTAVWPTSNYGYHERTGDPAIVLGEYGEVHPFEISPRHVAEPFESLLNRMRP